MGGVAQVEMEVVQRCSTNGKRNNPQTCLCLAQFGDGFWAPQSLNRPKLISIGFWNPKRFSAVILLGSHDGFSAGGFCRMNLDLPAFCWKWWGHVQHIFNTYIYLTVCNMASAVAQAPLDDTVGDQYPRPIRTFGDQSCWLLVCWWIVNNDQQWLIMVDRSSFTKWLMNGQD